MKPKRTHSRKPAAIAKSRWLAYATAGATSAFAMNSTEGAIHYSGPINQWIGGFHHAIFPLDQQGDSFVLIHYQIFSGGYGGTAHFGVAGLAGAAFAGFYRTCSGHPGFGFVSNLERGQVISNQPFVGPHNGLLWASWWVSCSGYHGQFQDNRVGFIGFRFNNGNGNQYGWARIVLAEYDQPIKLIDYAYGDVGDRVKAGQKSGQTMVPEEGSLGGLALGAAGLLAWRKRRSKAARQATD